jgi:hypothetical protein
MSSLYQLTEARRCSVCGRIRGKRVLLYDLGQSEHLYHDGSLDKLTKHLSYLEN